MVTGHQSQDRIRCHVQTHDALPLIGHRIRRIRIIRAGLGLNSVSIGGVGMGSGCCGVKVFLVVFTFILAGTEKRSFRVVMLVFKGSIQNGSLWDDHFVRYSRKSVTLAIFSAKFQFGDFQNVRYTRKSVISESGTSENLCIVDSGE